jgi:uncharacterized membrane protein YsdA (DUF1294 family)
MKTIDLIVCGWLVIFNTLALLTFGWDKWRAKKAMPRVSEITLVLLAALGGWLGGLLAMKIFRHKTVKWTFKLKYAVALIPFSAEIWAWLHWR